MNRTLIILAILCFIPVVAFSEKDQTPDPDMPSKCVIHTYTERSNFSNKLPDSPIKNYATSLKNMEEFMTCLHYLGGKAIVNGQSIDPREDYDSITYIPNEDKDNIPLRKTLDRCQVEAKLKTLSLLMDMGQKVDNKLVKQTAFSFFKQCVYDSAKNYHTKD